MSCPDRSVERVFETSPQRGGAIWVAVASTCELDELAVEWLRDAVGELLRDVPQATEVAVSAGPVAADAKLADRVANFFGSGRQRHGITGCIRFDGSGHQVSGEEAEAALGERDR